MTDVFNHEVDKYRVEISRGTSGGKVGFSVRAVGEFRDVVLLEALSLAKEAMQAADEMSPAEVRVK